MSENLDLVRSIYADWERGDYTSADWADPDVEFAWADGPEPGSRTGLPDMAEGWGQWLAAWDDFRSEAEGYHEIDDERVLVLGRNTARGKTSGLDLRQRPTKQAALFHVRDGKVTRLVLYWDRARAFADLGLKDG
jgi:ketosteroid isomerase-like protein